MLVIIFNTSYAAAWFFDGSNMDVLKTASGDWRASIDTHTHIYTPTYARTSYTIYISHDDVLSSIMNPEKSKIKRPTFALSSRSPCVSPTIHIHQSQNMFQWNAVCVYSVYC